MRGPLSSIIIVIAIVASVLASPRVGSAVPFDIIVPLEARISSEGSTGVQFDWGMVAATGSAISVADLENATISVVLSDPAVSIVGPSEKFVDNPPITTGIEPGEIGGRLFPFNQVLADLVEPGESLNQPDVSLWRFGVDFPTGHTSTATLTSIVAVGSHHISYTSTIEFGPFGNQPVQVVSGQRLSAIPEPSTALLLAAGLAGLGVRRRSAR